jgi:tetratricopeptide (TPR) repeat protein
MSGVDECRHRCWRHETSKREGECMTFDRKPVVACPPRNGDISLHRTRVIFAFTTLVLALVALPLEASRARVRENVAIPTPFEVGESPAGNYLAALVAGAERDTVAAATFSREALRYDPRNPHLLERAFVSAISNGNSADAFAFAERLIAKDPSNSLARLALGVKAVKAGNYALARSHFGKGVNGRERDVTAILLNAWTYVGSGKPKQAIELVDRLRDENFAVFRDYHAGLILDVANRPAEAGARMKSAYEADRNTLRLADAYARHLAYRGEIENAIRIYESFDLVLPSHPVVVAALAELKSGKPLEPLVRTPEQGAGEVLYGLGAAGGRQGDELAAIIYLRLALYLAPQNSLATITLADIYERIRQFEQAIDIYQSVLDHDPLRTTAEIQSCLVLETMGRSDDAMARLERILDEQPRNEDAFSALGNLQRAHKRYVEAAESYSRALQVSTKPDKANWPLYYFRGISHERARLWPQAEADLKTALRLLPEQPLVLNYLGYSWVDQGINLDEAFGMLRRAVELRPTDGYIVDSLGWANYKLGRHEDAVRDLERAIDLKPSDPVINDHLGDAYWRVGRKLEARFQWNHARDLGPEPEDKEKILRKIEDGLDESKSSATKAELTENGG